MAYAHATIATRFDFAARIRAGLSDAAEAWTRYRNYRSTLAQLSELSDHELEDLGLSRAGLRRAAFESAYEV